MHKIEFCKNVTVKGWPKQTVSGRYKGIEQSVKQHFKKVNVFIVKFAKHLYVVRKMQLFR